MGKWYGKVGYATPVEVKPSVWKDDFVERTYYGDLTRNISKWSTTADSTNDNLDLNNQISIVADPFAYDNFTKIKYVEFMGAKWKVTSVEPQRPRLILTVGGLYNGNKAST